MKRSLDLGEGLLVVDLRKGERLALFLATRTNFSKTTKVTDMRKTVSAI